MSDEEEEDQAEGNQKKKRSRRKRKKDPDEEVYNPEDVMGEDGDKEFLARQMGGLVGGKEGRRGETDSTNFSNHNHNHSTKFSNM